MDDIDNLDKSTAFIFSILILVNVIYIFGYLFIHYQIDIRLNITLFVRIMPIVISVVAFPGVILGFYYVYKAIVDKKKTIISKINYNFPNLMY